MSKRVRATARVKVILQISVNSPWGPDCTIEQVMNQARDSAIDELGRFISNKAPVSEAEAERRRQVFRLEGTPEVLAVLVEEER
jgi:hypothetical protein